MRKIVELHRSALATAPALSKRAAESGANVAIASTSTYNQPRLAVWRSVASTNAMSAAASSQVPPCPASM